MVRKLLILLLMVLLFVSCKKKNDTDGPQIIINSPAENQQFAVYDTISVKANVCATSKLQYINISVTDENFVTEFSANTINPDNNCYDVNIDLPITDIQLPSGVYYLLIKASDGTIETKKFQKIYITAVPKKLKYLLVITKNGTTIGLSKIDSTDALVPIKTITSDYCGSAVSSNAQQFYIAGRYTGDVSVFSTNDWQFQWSVPAIVSPPFPYFEAIDVYNSQLYVSYSEGKFDIYNASGNIRTSRVIDNGNFPVKFLPHNNYLITYERSPSGVDKYLVIYFTTSFTTYLKLQITFEIEHVFTKDDDHCIMFCNKDDQGTIKLFTISNHALWDSYTLSTGPVISSYQVDENNYLYAANDGIYWYNYQGTSSVLLYATSGAQNVVYDETASDFYVAEAYHTVKRFSFPSPTQQAAVNVPDSVINILPVYNRD